MTNGIPVTGQNVAEVVDKLRAGELPPVRTATIRLYTPNGCEVCVPLAESTDFGKLFQLAQAASAKALAAGWLAAAPQEKALAAGEETEPVGWVVRTMNQGRTGPTNTLHLYSTNPGWVKPFLVVYLNTPDEVRGFEAVSGLRIADIPEYVGEGRLERGKSPKTDSLIVAAKRPFAAVYKPNAKYSEEEAQATKAKGGAYTIPKKKFVRWAADSKPQAAQPATPTPQADPTPEELAEEYRFCHDEDEFAALESTRKRIWDAATGPGQRTRMKQAADAARVRLDELKEEPIPF